MKRFARLIDKELIEILARAPDKQRRARKLAEQVFQWLAEGGVARVEEGLKEEVLSVERSFAARESKVAEDLERR